ncbi:MAG: transcriptional regulator [Treponema sp.]|jgi:hypothetical protein|nr:transcriptional regulator [Treponema sp.]
MNGRHKLQAAENFSRARWKAALSRIQHFLHTGTDRLLSLHEVKDILKPKSETYRGMRMVPIKLIVGSEGRYQDFTKYFLPRSNHLRERWERIDEARLGDIALPPIQLYEIGGVYFVRDGNHRVSVMGSQGAEYIDAEVTSLSSEIALSPGMSANTLREAVVRFEKKLFYEKTALGSLTGDQNLDFSRPGQYDVLYNHILVHKYYLNEQFQEELPFDQALISWYHKVYTPIIQIIKGEKLSTQFPGRTAGDLYVWMVKHWDILKRKYGVHYAIADAVRDFCVKYGKAKGFFFPKAARLLNRLFKPAL